MSTHNICFLLRNKKDISSFRMKKKRLIYCYVTFTKRFNNFQLLAILVLKFESLFNNSTPSHTCSKFRKSIYLMLYMYLNPFMQSGLFYLLFGQVKFK